MLQYIPIHIAIVYFHWIVNDVTGKRNVHEAEDCNGPGGVALPQNLLYGLLYSLQFYFVFCSGIYSIHFRAATQVLTCFACLRVHLRPIILPHLNTYRTYKCSNIVLAHTVFSQPVRICIHMPITIRDIIRLGEISIITYIPWEKELCERKKNHMHVHPKERWTKRSLVDGKDDIE